MTVFARVNILVCILLAAGCSSTQPFICGTALFQMAMDDVEAQQAALYVYTDQVSEADFSLRVSVTEIATGATTEAIVYLRHRRADEIVQCAKPVAFAKRGALWRSWPKESITTLFRERIEAWILFSKHVSGGIALRYGEDARVEQSGFLIVAVWTKEPNKAPEPTSLAVTPRAHGMWNAKVSCVGARGAPARAVAHL